MNVSEVIDNPCKWGYKAQNYSCEEATKAQNYSYEEKM